jgi:hypothetical protein
VNDLDKRLITVPVPVADRLKQAAARRQAEVKRQVTMGEMLEILLDSYDFKEAQ